MTPETMARTAHHRLPMRLATAALAVLTLAACQARMASEQPVDSLTTGSLPPASITATSKASKAWQADPGNIRLGIAYSRDLEALEQHQQAMRVLGQVLERNPGNTELQIYYGKQLVANSRSDEAVPILQKVVDAGKADWKTQSALGSALAQQGKFDIARQHYQAALALKPGEPSVYNNIGMSYMLQGKLDLAEKTLRQAMSLPGNENEPKLRQNLALALGLQGRFKEAREMASRDLPPQLVEANMAYLKRMLAQQNSWQKLKPASKSGT